MRSVLIGTQEADGAGGPDGPPPPADASASGSNSGFDPLLSLLEGADGNDTSDDGSDTSNDGTGGAAAVSSDLKQLLNDLAKLTQSNGVGTQVTV
jgi:hypothetical protein